MYLILLSGGSGKRLWPLSNDSRSKQFLKILNDENDLNNNISMIQRVWYQLQRAKLAEHTIISTSKAQVDMINNQLGSGIPSITEPSRRDTYPAILLASSYLYSVKNVDLNEIVVVMPVDPYVEDEFFHHLYTLENVIQHSNANLALIGIQPTFPSEKYGYIVPNNAKAVTDNNTVYQKVEYFSEKPNQVKAQQLLTQGAMWNSGIFAFKLEFIIKHLESSGLPLDYEQIVKQYTYLSKNSFDYEVVEKTKNIVVVPFKGAWKDLGTWNTLTEEMTKSLIGKGSISSDSQNVHVVNELDIPVSVLSLSNIVVAVSPDGVLVSDKKASSRVKEVVNQFNQRPMYEERRWGSYRVLDYIKYNDSNEVLTKRISISANKNLSYQKHFHRREVWTIINGTGLFVINNRIKKVKPGDILEIPLGASHAIKALTDLEFIEVQIGSELIEEDIVQIFMTWEEIESHCISITKNQ